MMVSSLSDLIYLPADFIVCSGTLVRKNLDSGESGESGESGGGKQKSRKERG